MHKRAYRMLVMISVVALTWLPVVDHSPSTIKASQADTISAVSATTMLGVNLITNGDAEAGIGSTDGSVITIPGWGNVGNVATVVQYGSAGGFPTLSSPGPSERGVNFFAGGPDSTGQDVSYLVQTIDVSSLQLSIDTGSLRYIVQGWFGGYDTQTDWSGIRIFFLNATDTLPEIGSAQAGPVTANERNNVTGLVLRSTTGTIPPQTRFILINLDFNRFSGAGTYNDGYADNVSLVLGSRSFLPVVIR